MENWTLRWFKYVQLCPCISTYIVAVHGEPPHSDPQPRKTCLSFSLLTYLITRTWGREKCFSSLNRSMVVKLRTSRSYHLVDRRAEHLGCKKITISSMLFVFLIYYRHQRCDRDSDHHRDRGSIVWSCQLNGWVEWKWRADWRKLEHAGFIIFNPAAEGLSGFAGLVCFCEYSRTLPSFRGSRFFGLVHARSGVWQTVHSENKKTYDT